MIIIIIIMSNSLCEVLQKGEGKQIMLWEGNVDVQVMQPILGC